MQTIFIFEVEILKAGTSEIFKTIHLIGYNLFQVSHIAMHIVYDEDGEFKNELLEVGSIRKLPEVKRIYNPEFVIEMLELEDEEDDENFLENGYNPNLPFKLMENINGKDERIMKFKHSCGHEISCVNFDWPYILCPNKVCNKKILRKDIEFVGGIYLFVGE